MVSLLLYVTNDEYSSIKQLFYFQKEFTHFRLCNQGDIPITINVCQPHPKTRNTDQNQPHILIHWHPAVAATFSATKTIRINSTLLSDALSAIHFLKWPGQDGNINYHQTGAKYIVKIIEGNCPCQMRKLKDWFSTFTPVTKTVLRFSSRRYVNWEGKQNCRSSNVALLVSGKKVYWSALLLTLFCVFLRFASNFK